METTVQINRRKTAAPQGGWKVCSAGHEISDAPGGYMRPGPLDLNICINRLAGLLSPFERISLRTVLGGSVLLVMADPGLMAAMFFTIIECAGRLAPGGTVTIHTALAPLQTGLVSKGMGNACVLLSFHAAAKGGRRIRLNSPGTITSSVPFPLSGIYWKRIMAASGCASALQI